MVKKKCLIELCILSFNGGLAQNNAGAGICHSLSHSTEEILNIPHQEAIGIFLKPSISLMIFTVFLFPLIVKPPALPKASFKLMEFS